MIRVRFLHLRRVRRLVVVVQLTAFALACVPLLTAHGRGLWSLHVALWAEVALGLTAALLGASCGVGWGQPGRDERQRQSWIEARAIAYQVLMVAALPFLFWFGIGPLGFATLAGIGASRRAFLATALLIALPTLPIAICAWREPDMARE